MKTRFRNPQKSEISGAVTLNEWKALCKSAISLAEKTGDRRLGGLQKALETNQCEKILRSFSIICENDLKREFKGA